MVLLTALPSMVPFPLRVVVFPSLETTLVLVPTSLPSFFNVAENLLGPQRLMAMWSAPYGIPEPVTGASLPSYFTVKPYATGFPSAPVPSKLYFTLSPSAATVRVTLFGPSMPVYFDFSALSFQVPRAGLSWPSINAGIARQRATTDKIKDTRFIFSPLTFAFGFRWASGRVQIFGGRSV